MQSFTRSSPNRPCSAVAAVLHHWIHLDFIGLGCEKALTCVPNYRTNTERRTVHGASTWRSSWYPIPQTVNAAQFSLRFAWPGYPKNDPAM
jgi:hypothetical protein